MTSGPSTRTARSPEQAEELRRRGSASPAAAAAAAGDRDRSVLDQLGVQRTATGHRLHPVRPERQAGRARHQRRATATLPLPSFSRSSLAVVPARRKAAGKGRSLVCRTPSSMSIGSTADRICSTPTPARLTGGEVWGDRSWEASGPQVARLPEPLSERSSSAPGDGRPARPQIADRDRVIYELHLRGFTRHPSSGVAHPGTYLGLIEKIPYLQSLGITTVELLPLLEFDETENFRRNPVTGERLLNFWGYSPVSFFAPKAAYAADPTPGAAAGRAHGDGRRPARRGARGRRGRGLQPHRRGRRGSERSAALASAASPRRSTTCAIRRPAGRSTSPAAATRSTRTIRWSAG